VLEEIPDPLDGERVDRVVSMFTGVSRSAASAAIADGLVKLDSTLVTKASQRVSTGQILSVEDAILDEPDEMEPDPSVDVDIAYSDEHVIVVRKRAGQVVHPGSGNVTGTIVQGLLAKFPEIRDVGQANRPGVVHRLDKGTSGVFSVARSALGYDSLTAQLFDRTATRRYLTLAWGHPKTPRGVIEAPIGRAVRDPTRMVVRDDGKAARTSYTVLATWHEPTVSLFSCALDTGRTHQIRVHMEAIHHPIVGDFRYGSGRDTLGMGRPALHAAELGFEHPESGEWLEFSAPLPDDMKTLITSFGRPETGDVPE
jgi:23S rRNA pseudouridine1911/1915/1917 synthase